MHLVNLVISFLGKRLFAVEECSRIINLYAGFVVALFRYFSRCFFGF